MCATADRFPGSAADALRMADAGLDYLNSAGAGDLQAAATGEVLTSLSELQSKLAAARAAFLARFDAADGHDDDGYATSSAWLAAKAKMSRKGARAADAAAPGPPAAGRRAGGRGDLRILGR
jgi:hypothetical protein